MHVTARRPTAPHIKHHTRNPLRRIRAAGPTRPNRACARLKSLIMSSGRLTTLTPRMHTHVSSLVIRHKRLRTGLTSLRNFPGTARDHRFLRSHLHVLSDRIKIALQPRTRKNRNNTLPKCPLDGLIRAAGTHIHTDHRHLNMTRRTTTHRTSTIARRLDNNEQLNNGGGRMDSSTKLASIARNALPSTHRKRIPTQPNISHPRGITKRRAPITPQVKKSSHIATNTKSARNTNSDKNTGNDAHAQHLTQTSATAGTRQDTTRTSKDGTPSCKHQPNGGALTRTINRTVGASATKGVSPCKHTPEDRHPRHRVTETVKPSNDSFSNILHIITGLPSTAPTRITLTQHLSRLALNARMQRTPQKLDTTSVRTNIIRVNAPDVNSILRRNARVTATPTVSTTCRRCITNGGAARTGTCRSLIRLDAVTHRRLNRCCNTGPNITISPGFAPLLHIGRLITRVRSGPTFTRTTAHVHIKRRALVRHFIGTVHRLFKLRPGCGGLVTRMLGGSSIFFHKPLFSPRNAPLASFTG